MVGVLETIRAVEPAGLTGIPKDEAALFAEAQADLCVPKVNGVSCADMASGFRAMPVELYLRLCRFVDGGPWSIDPARVERCPRHNTHEVC